MNYARCTGPRSTRRYLTGARSTGVYGGSGGGVHPTPTFLSLFLSFLITDVGIGVDTTDRWRGGFDKVRREEVFFLVNPPPHRPVLVARVNPHTHFRAEIYDSRLSRKRAFWIEICCIEVYRVYPLFLPPLLPCFGVDNVNVWSLCGGLVLGSSPPPHNLSAQTRISLNQGSGLLGLHAPIYP